MSKLLEKDNPIPINLRLHTLVDLYFFNANTQQFSDDCLMMVNNLPCMKLLEQVFFCTCCWYAAACSAATAHTISTAINISL